MKPPTQTTPTEPRRIGAVQRRSLLATIGAAALWPMRASPQSSALPLVGFLGARSGKIDGHVLTAFLQGLEQAGYAERRNVLIEYRWADGFYDRLPTLAAELVRLRPNVIVAIGASVVTLAAKASTTSIPIVFSMGGDPVALGIVSDVSRPQGNLTGVTTYSAPLDAKRMELLRDVAPAAKLLAVIINTGNPSADSELRQAQTAARSFGQTLHVFGGRTDQEIEAAFRAIGQLQPDALAVSFDSFFVSRRARIVALVAELRVPAIYSVREFLEVGGLMSYGSNLAEMNRQVGLYTGRVLKGALPSSLPVQQPRRFELVLNLKAAKAQRIVLPQSVLLRADEVIE